MAPALMEARHLIRALSARSEVGKSVNAYDI